jgi:8-oxo-dGTP pyrophosphatase MutT (NUDIX family)
VILISSKINGSWKNSIFRGSILWVLRGTAMKKDWNYLYSTTVFKNRLVNIRQDKYHFLPNDIIKDFTVFELGDWVNIIPVTEDGRVVTIRQYRHGIRRDTIEIPGGLISEEDTTPMEAAVREMTEETGYISTDVVHIGTVEPNPALQTNKCYSFLARNCILGSNQMLDPTEAIRVELVKKEEIYQMILKQKITHGLVVAAFAHLLIYESNGKHHPV